MCDELKLHKELSSITHEIYHKGYTPPLNGNMSVRLDETHILITPSYVCKGLVTEDRILKVNFDLEVIGCNVKPSIDLFYLSVCLFKCIGQHELHSV